MTKLYLVEMGEFARAYQAISVANAVASALRAIRLAYDHDPVSVREIELDA